MSGSESSVNFVYCDKLLLRRVQMMTIYSPLTWGIYDEPPPDVPECGFVGELCPPPIRSKLSPTFSVVDAKLWCAVHLILQLNFTVLFLLGRFISGLRQLTVPPHRRVTYAYGGRAFAVASRSVDVELTAETFTQPFLQLFCFWPSS